METAGLDGRDLGDEHLCPWHCRLYPETVDHVADGFGPQNDAQKVDKLYAKQG
ncbi:MAG: hypothetical protein Pars92KO_17510 [Parasphingorhabdus sp.]